MNCNISRLILSRQGSILVRQINIFSSEDAAKSVRDLFENDIKNLNEQQFLSHLKWLYEHDQQFTIILYDRKLGQKLVDSVQSYVRAKNVQFNYLLHHFFCTVAKAGFICDIYIIKSFLFNSSLIQQYCVLDIFVYFASYGSENSNQFITQNNIDETETNNMTLQSHQTYHYLIQKEQYGNQKFPIIYIILRELIIQISDTQQLVFLAQKIIQIIIYLIHASHLEYINEDFVNMIFDLAKENTKQRASENYYDLLQMGLVETNWGSGIRQHGYDSNNINLDLQASNCPDLATLSNIIIIEHNQEYPTIEHTILNFMNTLFSQQYSVNTQILDTVLELLFANENLFFLQWLREKLYPSNCYGRQAAQIIKNISFYTAATCDNNLMLICVFALGKSTAKLLSLLPFNEKVETMYLFSQYLSFLFNNKIYEFICQYNKDSLKRVFKDMCDIYMNEMQGLQINQLQDIFSDIKNQD